MTTKVLGIQDQAAQPQKFPEFVSMVRLIAAPDRYQGKFVGVHGFVARRFEDESAFMTEDDFRYGNAANALWLNYDSRTDKDDSDHGQWCIVEGYFSANDHGHLDLFSGAIDHSRVRACSPPVSPLVAGSASPPSVSRQNQLP
jgi:hypothetical protein